MNMVLDWNAQRIAREVDTLLESDLLESMAIHHLQPEHREQLVRNLVAQLQPAADSAEATLEIHPGDLHIRLIHEIHRMTQHQGTAAWWDNPSLKKITAEPSHWFG